MRNRAGLPVVAIVALLYGVRSADCQGSVNEASMPVVTLRVINEGGIDPAVLRLGKKEAMRIFRYSGIRLTWIECSQELESGKNDPCHRALGPSEFWLRVVTRRPVATTQEMLGFSELDESRQTGSAGIYYPGAQALSARSLAGIGEILGSIAAHEVGHLLLGGKAHSSSGVMVAHWSHWEFELLSRRQLNFTRDESSRLRERISNSQASTMRRDQ